MAVNRNKILVTFFLTAVILIVAVLYLLAVGYFPKKYDAEIAQAAAQYGIDENLIRAVIWTESKFDESALSLKGASGLMQLMPGTRSEQSERSGIAADGSAYSEIMLGTGYLARMMKAAGDEETALMAYNAGLANVLNWDEPYPESVNYVKRVNFARKVYIYLR